MIGTLVSAALWPLAAAAAASSAYVSGLTLLSAVARNKRGLTALSEPSIRFAVLVPAHNEEAVIERLLRSLEALDYPRGLFDVWVIADNCDDRTEELARAAGANVLVRRDETLPGKGRAVAWALAQLPLADYDGVVMVDADSALEAGFLRSMDGRIASGAQAVQGYYGVLSPDSTAAALRSITLALVHYVRPLGKGVYGGSCGLKGNGMAFTTGLLAKEGWRSFSVVEDAEQHMRLVEAGYRVEFAPEAVVRGEMPDTLRGARTQNLRWEAGRWGVARRWAPRLLWSGLTKRSLVRLDAALEALVPPLSVVGAMALAATAGGLALGNRPLWLTGAAALAGLTAHVLGGMLVAKAPLRAWRSLAVAPLYATWKVALYAQALAGAGSRRWVRTPRAPSEE